MRNLRRLVKWSIRVVKVVLLYRLYILGICRVRACTRYTPRGQPEDHIEILAQVVNYSLRFLFEVEYGKNRVGSDKSADL